MYRFASGETKSYKTSPHHTLNVGWADTPLSGVERRYEAVARLVRAQIEVCVTDRKSVGLPVSHVVCVVRFNRAWLLMS